MEYKKNKLEQCKEEEAQKRKRKAMNAFHTQDVTHGKMGKERASSLENPAGSIVSYFLIQLSIHHANFQLLYSSHLKRWVSALISQLGHTLAT